MVSRRLLMTISVVATIGAVAYVATVAQTAEKAREDEQQMLNAAVDVTPLLKKIDKLDAELVALRSAAEACNEKLQAMQDNVSKMQKAMDTLKQTDKWQYHFLYQSSANAANRLGEEGWELVASPKDNLLIFKKPLTDKQEPNAP